MAARLSDLERALKDWKITLREPGKGSHWKFYAPDGKMYPVPAGNGRRTEISDRYIRALCRTFGIDEQQLMSKL